MDSVSANFFFLCGAISTKDAKDSESDGIAGIFGALEGEPNGVVGCWPLEQPKPFGEALKQAHICWNFG